MAKDDQEPAGAGEPEAASSLAEKRAHRATFATDKHRPGSYLIRIVGPTADKFKPGRTIPVTRKDNSESWEELGSIVWAGVDDDTNGPVALYHFTPKPREDAADDLPF